MNTTYMINANADIAAYHQVIIAAIKNDGVFSEDFADIFTLTKTPEGSAVAYILDFA